MSDPRFVEVEWIDAISVATWRAPDEMPRVTQCISRGWLIVDEKEQVTLAATRQPINGDLGEIISIPRGMVKRMRRLKVSYGR